jgi:hypothetical protein
MVGGHVYRCLEIVDRRVERVEAAFLIFTVDSDAAFTNYKPDVPNRYRQF